MICSDNRARAAAAALLALTALALGAATAVAYPAGSPALTVIGARITKRPAIPTNRTKARFAWKLEGTVTSTSCRLDAAAYKACRGKISYSGLVAGTHTFRLRVRGRDNGRAVTVTRSVRWRIDLTPPTAPPTVSGGAAGWSAGPVEITGFGSTDPGGAVARYDHRSSTDGGVTWSAPEPGATDTVSASGTTLVQVRAVDTAGNVSAWAPLTAGAANTAMVDATPPTAPTLSGALAGWQTVASETVSAAGSTDAHSGLSGYQYRTSADAGATWSAVQAGASAVVSAEGRTDVELRAVDAVGNHSAWSTAIVRIDNTPPTAPTVTGGSALWRSLPSVATSASGSADSGSGVAGYEYERSTDGGTTWSAAAAGSSLAVSAEGETLVRYAAVDGTGLESPWTQATVRLDRTDPTAPAVAGGSAAWQNVASVSPSASGSTDAGGSGFDHYAYETSDDAGTTWSAAAPGALVTVSAEGETLVRFVGVDAAGNSSPWTQATVRIDRSAPRAPVVAGGSSAWKNAASVTVSASGSADAGSGVAGYEHETSTDGGTTWSAAAAGASLALSAEGETLVRFRAVDVAGFFTSPWTPATVRIDRTAPTAPAAAGGSLTWSRAAQITITGGGSTDSPGSGVASYQYRTSTDGGATWSSAAAGASVDVTANGETLVQFRAVDVSGLRSGWAPAANTAAATARIDRAAPSTPSVSGGSNTWKSQAQATVSASGSNDPLSGLAGYEYRESTDAGATWSPAAAGAADAVSAEGETLVQFRAVDNTGNTSAWTPSAATAGSRVRLDRTSPTDPTVTGGSLSWQSVPSVSVAASASTDAGGSGFSGYEYRTSKDGGVTWSSAAAGSPVTVTAQGQTLVAFRAVDGAGNTSGWVQGTARIDRTAPSAPAVAGGSSSWQATGPVTVAGSGSTDSGGSGLAGYEYRTSLDGGAWSLAAPGASVNVTAEGTTQVQFRSVDSAGNTSAWTPSSATAASTVKLDLTAPSDPSVAGGSSSWRNLALVAVTASGSTDARSGLAAYEYEMSTDSGATWSVATSGSSLSVSAEVETLVRFRAVDKVGRTSAWVQATIRLDRTAPSAPSVSGGSLSWQNVPSVTVSGSGSTDTPAADGVNHYEHRTSTDGGATWSAAASGGSVGVSAEGTTLVQFRAVDGAANASAWAPASPTGASTVKLDRGPPTDPTVTGGTTGWQNAASALVSASGSTDGGSAVSTYQYQTAFNGGPWSSSTSGASVTVSAEGTTLVRFRALDAAGNTSNWVQASVQLDRTVPTSPAVSGGSTSWSSAASRTISASGSTDAVSGVNHYDFRTSTNGGTTWSAATSGAAAVISAEGTTIVQFRAVDGAGITSAWVPATSGSSNTVKLDRTAPTLPTVSGGSLTCTNGKITIKASGSIDSLSGLSSYQYRVSNNGGSTWGAATSASTVTFRSAGTYIVQFRGVDNAGNISAWAPAAAGPGNTACHM
ncbi:MAG TPA: hypothetical protein VE777_08865 [Gaiellales bacterium]|nr:hypothetical protein [Gaiellales bacterium]